MTESQKKANSKYHAKLDEIKIRVPAGKKDIYKSLAEKHGMSLNAFIVSLIENALAKES